ncbi:unnamed protein product [Clonostachys rosea]|uniref:non-specific serine/threonine protein kinase n=1 Tax=Bionectria ochroleuca TaxID=29856 RepID=A0ABY6UAH5_BIOOC|nr:unnamed protein product [Clonostachys rosea]
MRHRILLPQSAARPLIWGRSLSVTSRASVASISSAKQHAQDTNAPVEEERYQLYDPKIFYPARIGEKLGGKYRLVSKLGWGTTSTVWLARETKRGWFFQSHQYVALKIANSSDIARQNANQELEVSNHVLSASASHPGRQLIRPVIDSFEIQGTNKAKHLCLVFEALRQPLSAVGKQLGHDGRLPPRVLRTIVPSILKSLDFLHSECRTIHTDLKSDHFMVPFEDPSILDEYLRQQKKTPPMLKESRGRPIYETRHNFGRLKRGIQIAKLTDFGLAVCDQKPGTLHFHNIQPLEYTAPEVLFKTGWSYSADIWNLGLVLWELASNASLLDGRTLGQPGFSHFTRYAQMIRLLGPPPARLLDRIDRETYNRFYDERGKYSWMRSFMYPELVPGESFNFQKLTPIVNESDKAKFISFIRRMLAWLPEERPTAGELLSDPWLEEESGLPTDPILNI